MEKGLKISRRRWILVAAVAAGIGIGALTTRTALTQEQLAAEPAAALRSDKADYASGETASLTGEGFQALEPIQLDVSIEAPVTGAHVGASTFAPFAADANGGFVAEYAVPPDADGMMMRATAVGGSSGLSATAVLNNPAWVDTNMDDYPPGSLVYIAGGGFLANEMVELQVLHVGFVDSDGSHYQGPLDTQGEGFDSWIVQADENGDLVDVTWYVCEVECVNALLELTATGLTSDLTAQARFTDARVFTATINPTSAVTGVAVPYTLTVTNTATSGETMAAIQVAIPAGAGTPSGISVTATNPGPTPLSWTVVAAPPAGTMRFLAATAGDSLAPNGTAQITFTATATTAGSKAWTTTAFGQTNFSGQPFGTQSPTVTVTSCGNGVADGGEQCDLGAANGTSTACCTATCTFRAAGQTCRGSAGQCDVAETCTGSAAACPADAFASSATLCTGTSQGGACDNDTADHCTGTSNTCVDAFRAAGFECRASAGQCDVAESCTGTAGACPADAFASNTTSCTGTSQGGACDDDPADHCTGTSNGCVDVFRAAGFECRASAGQCDVAESCTGTAGACPADAFASNTTSCTGTSQGGACDDDPADHCTGTSNGCVDVFRAAGFECRASAGQCDLAESCTGTSGACPVDAFASNTTSCTGTSQGGACDDDPADHCTGTSNSCVDVFRAAGFECRASAGQCDVAESCTGTSGACPADAFASSTTSCTGTSQGGACDDDPADHCTGTSNDCVDVFRAAGFECRASAGQCDVAESCTGASGACPADAFASNTTSCLGTSQGGACDDDPADHCTGTSNDCVDVFQAAGFECRASAGQCDVAESCTGTSGACPADAFASNTTSCLGTSQGGACDNDPADHCTGTSNDCVDVFQAAGFECRASAGQCDVAESCTGTSGACPADAFASNTTSCLGTSQGGVCDDDPADHCTGTSNDCVDVFQAAGFECRASAGQCDVAESCTGTSGACPADGFASNTTSCIGISQGGACDNDPADHCTGTSNGCVDVFRAAGFECRASAGQCDVAESCTGTSGACPADGFASNTTSCLGISQGGACDDDPADHCTGTSNGCVDVFRAAGFECRASAGQCDVAESCTGTSGACPANAFASNTTSCLGTSQGGVCDNDAADHCTGTSNGCVDVFRAAGFECRPSAGQCDVAESCTGTAGACPADAFASSTTSCTGTSQGGACDDDPADHCTGTSNGCVDVFRAAGFECRASAGQCDVAETCTGTSATCPANGFQPAGTGCADDGNVCTDDQCNGSGACTHPNNMAPCNDGNACTSPDVCNAGACVGGAAVYGFTGFFPPVDNPNTLNVGKSGRTFPVKFQLPLCSGGYVSRLSAVTGITYRAIACSNFLPQDPMATDADTSGASGLHYDSGAGQYIFNWQTSGSFANKCYELRIDFDNGTNKTALFKFTK